MIALGGSIGAREFKVVRTRRTTQMDAAFRQTPSLYGLQQLHQHLRCKQMAGERAAATAALIAHAIQDRACLSGTHVQFRVRFAPHALGRDKYGRHVVIAFEYGGLTLGQVHWVHFLVKRLRDLQLTEDPWRSGPLNSRPPSDLTEIETAVDESWVRNTRSGVEALENVSSRRSTRASTGDRSTDAPLVTK